MLYYKYYYAFCFRYKFEKSIRHAAFIELLSIICNIRCIHNIIFLQNIVYLTNLQLILRVYKMTIQNQIKHFLFSIKY